MIYLASEFICDTFKGYIETYVTVCNCIYWSFEFNLILFWFMFFFATKCTRQSQDEGQQQN